MFCAAFLFISATCCCLADNCGDEIALLLVKPAAVPSLQEPYPSEIPSLAKSITDMQDSVRSICARFLPLPSLHLRSPTPHTARPLLSSSARSTIPMRNTRKCGNQPMRVSATRGLLCQFHRYRQALHHVPPRVQRCQIKGVQQPFLQVPQRCRVFTALRSPARREATNQNHYDQAQPDHADELQEFQARPCRHLQQFQAQQPRLRRDHPNILNLLPNDDPPDVLHVSHPDPRDARDDDSAKLLKLEETFQGVIGIIDKMSMKIVKSDEKFEMLKKQMWEEIAYYLDEACRTISRKCQAAVKDHQKE